MGILNNLEAWLDFEEEIDKDPDMEPGYSTGKWSDDDDFGITPFLGPNR
jgi:hypothetical protein